MFDAIQNFGIPQTICSLIVVALFILAFTHGGKGGNGGSSSGGSSGGGSSTPPTPPAGN